MSSLDEVRRIVHDVPRGQVITYGEIAALIQTSPRHAGRLVSQLGDGSPWWRVVYSDGSPATCHNGAAPSMLAHEAIPMCGDRVDIRRARAHRPKA
ncbi:MGMT family protein [Pseudoclavibacter terrae]|uniref:MGMT family protein n=1 Tax=Pseudoclavibacter terrae TaxID=1530195 RepID=UPI00232F0C1D|nr:MGMT family protein [Pseudoclavibacter terrae]